MKENQSYIDAECRDWIVYLAETTPKLSKFEVELINDRLEAIQKYGDHATITKKQRDIFEKLYIRTRIRRIVKLHS